VITKFKRYGQPITKKSLERTITWLREKQSNSIDVLLKKLSQLALESIKHEENLQHAIEILSMKNKNLSSY
jgi:predicted type IV restriction endonuclease